MTWHPDYSTEFARRQKMLMQIQSSNHLVKGSIEYYRDNPVEFINDWCVTQDPRNAAKGVPTLMPFLLFERQEQFVDFLMWCIDDEECGLVEKCRDMGATWVCCALSVWLWRFRDGTSVGWGSRKETLVDKIGDPDSIFEKMRIIIDYLPRVFWPEGFDPKKHCSYMKIINPQNGSTVTGEAGDNIGRGGRSLVYFKDESGHYERPEKIEAALSENTNCQIDISSVNGTGNIFYRRRQAGEVWTPGAKIRKGKVRVFIMDWRDHPGKDQEWYDTKRKKAEDEGLLTIFSQEVDRDYASAVQGVIIPAKWVKAAIDAHIALGIEADGKERAALDVADSEAGDKNAIAINKGVILKYLESWHGNDTGVTARTAVTICKRFKVKEMQYDCIGVGSGVKAETNRLRTEGIIDDNLLVEKWDASDNPLFPEDRLIPGDDESPLNKDFFASLKSQGWWQLRIRFEKTYKAVTKGIVYPHDELISIPSDLPEKDELINELSQPTFSTNGKGKIVVNKTPDGTKSPNNGDGVMMLYWPVIKPGFFI